MRRRMTRLALARVVRGSAHAKVAKAKSFQVKTREESGVQESLEKIRSYFILLYLSSRFHRSPAILLEVRLLVWTIGCYQAISSLEPREPRLFRHLVTISSRKQIPQRVSMASVSHATAAEVRRDGETLLWMPRLDAPARSLGEQALAPRAALA